MTHTTWLQDHSEVDDHISTDIKDMVKERGKTCLSIIVPTHRLGQDRQADLKEVQRTVFVAKQEVMYKSGDYLKSLDELFQQIDFKRNKEGLGIFVSPSIKKLVKFPFPVTKKVVINDFFHLHDLLFFENYRIPYYLLDLSKKEIHLFRGMMDHLEEVDDENFPIQITDDYEYSKPSRSTSHSGYSHVKAFEKDKSQLQQLRLKNIFHNADRLLSNYLTKETPIILCGAKKDISLYRSTAIHSEQVITSMSDNYKGSQLHDLEVLAWMEIRSFIDWQKQKLVEDLKEEIGKGMAVCGIKEVWNAVKEGRGWKLIVEKNYGRSAFLTADNRLHLIHPAEKYQRYPDIVNEIITTVLEKNGNVTIVEQDVLKEYNRIALINRY